MGGHIMRDMMAPDWAACVANGLGTPSMRSNRGYQTERSVLTFSQIENLDGNLKKHEKL